MTLWYVMNTAPLIVISTIILNIFLQPHPQVQFSPTATSPADCCRCLRRLWRICFPVTSFPIFGRRRQMSCKRSVCRLATTRVDRTRPSAIRLVQRMRRRSAGTVPTSDWEPSFDQNPRHGRTGKKYTKFSTIITQFTQNNTFLVADRIL